MQMAVRSNEGRHDPLNSDETLQLVTKLTEWFLLSASARNNKLRKAPTNRVLLRNIYIYNYIYTLRTFLWVPGNQ